MLKKIRQYFASPINKKAASITALALIALAIPLTVFISQQQQEIRQRAQEVTTKGGGNYVSLTLAPSILEKAPGETFDVELYFDAQIYSITGVDITINYNPSILQMERFTPVSTFNNVLINNPPNNTKGEYRYAAVDTINAPQTGRITVGIITFKTQNATGTSYVDLNNIQITALDQSSAIPTANNTQGKYAVVIPTPTPTTAPTETPIPVTPEPIGSCATLYNRIIKTFGNSCGSASYDKVADLNKNGRISVADYSKFLTYSNNATTCENALNDPTDPCTTPGTTTAPAQPTPTSTPAASPIPTPVAAIIGDANGDGTADILDFNIWRDEFLLTFGKPTTLRADFNKDDRVDLLDFSIWRNAISNPPPRSPTSAPSPTTNPDIGINLIPYPNNPKVSVTSGDETKIFDVQSTGAYQVDISYSPYGIGVGFKPASLQLNTNEVKPVNIVANYQQKAGVYNINATLTIKTMKGESQLSFPVEVTVAYPNIESRVFITSTTYKGDFAPYASRPVAVCNGQAKAAGLGGTWEAWISWDGALGEPAERFKKYAGNYKLLNGTVIALNWDDLTDGSLLHRIDIDEFGKLTSSGVWTNTLPNGKLESTSRNCSNWSSSSNNFTGGLGHPLEPNKGWTSSTYDMCNAQYALYCFEQ